MASLKELKGRINSVKSTQKITKAKQMVAAAKLRRAQAAAEAARPYAERLTGVMASLASKVAGDSAPKLLAGTGADQRHQHHRPEATDLLDLGLGEGVGDGDPGATGVLLPGLGRGEVQVAEGAVLRVGERLDGAAWHRHPGEREPLGVDHFDAPGHLRLCEHVVRESKGDGAPLLVEGGEGGEGAGREQLEVVELARGRTELREGTHRSILTELVEFQGMRVPGVRSRP